MAYKILTMNLRYPSVKDGENGWAFRYEGVAKFINQEKPLIIGAQEVYDHMRDDIIRLTENYDAFGITRTPNGEGVPIFYDKTQLEIIEGGNFWLSETPLVPGSKDWGSFCVRMCTWVEFAFKNNRDMRFRFFNTHLDHVSKEAQIKGIEVVLSKIAALNKKEVLPAFLMGDFNAKPQSETIKYINERIEDSDINFKSVYENGIAYGTTFHDFTGRVNGEPIDYIYYTKDLQVNNVIIYRDKVNNRYISDHYPLGFTINF